MPSATSDARISSCHHELLSQTGPNRYKVAYLIVSIGVHTHQFLLHFSSSTTTPEMRPRAVSCERAPPISPRCGLHQESVRTQLTNRCQNGLLKARKRRLQKPLLALVQHTP
jgi:hypothetical protein